MNSFLLVFFICCINQICMSASIHHEIDDDSLERFDLNEILSLQSEWRAIPGINQQGIDNIANILRKTTDPHMTGQEFFQNLLDMLNIVLNIDVAEDKQVRIGISTSIDKTDSSKKSNKTIVYLSGEPLPIEDSSELEKVLSSKLNATQTTRVVTFFEEIKADHLEKILTDLIKVAVRATLPDTHVFKNGKIIPKAVEMKNE